MTDYPEITQEQAGALIARAVWIMEIQLGTNPGHARHAAQTIMDAFPIRNRTQQAA